MRGRAAVAGWAIAIAASVALSSTRARADELHDALAKAQTLAQDALTDGDKDQEARAILATLLTTPRDTSEGRDIAARASFLLGSMDEAKYAFADAMKHYRDVFAIDAGNYYAAAAKGRVDALTPYEYDFGQLARLEYVRQNAIRASSDHWLQWFDDMRKTWTYGRIRDEAALFLADGWLSRVHLPGKAIAPAMEVAQRKGALPTLRAHGYDVAYAAMMEAGRGDEVQTIERDPDAPQSLRTRIVRDRRRRILHTASLRVVGLSIGTLAVATIVTLIRKRWRVAGRALLDAHVLVAIAIASVGGYILGERWETGEGKHFLPFGAALFGVHCLVAALRGALGDRAEGGGRVLRIAGGALAAMCVLSAAYLVLERGEVRAVPLLTGFGL